MRPMRLLGIAVTLSLLIGCSSRSAVVPSSPISASGSPVTPYVFQRGGAPGGFVRFALPDAGAGSFITRGLDERMWYAGSTYPTGYVAKIDYHGKVVEYALPTQGVQPGGLVAGPDGNIWVCETNVARIAKVYPPTGAVTEYSLAHSYDTPYRIAAGADGDLWFTLQGEGYIGKISTGGVSQLYQVLGAQNYYGIAPGPDGRMWFTGTPTFGTGLIGWIAPDGTYGGFSFPNAMYGPEDIITGPDGNLWFTVPTDDAIVRMTTTGTMTWYAIAGEPLELSPGDKNSIFFTYWSDTKLNGVGSITMDGATSYYPLPRGALPFGIAEGNDGNEWTRVAGRTGQLVDVFLRLSMSVSPSPVTFSGIGQQQTLTVAEQNYQGTWTATSSNPSVVTITPGSQSNLFTAQSVGEGKATLTIRDSVGNSIVDRVTVL